MDQDEVAKPRDAGFYAKIFAGLTLATVTEILTIYVVPFFWLRLVLLLAMAFVQSMLLVMNFMHLRWDRMIFSMIFFCGFLMAILLVLAFLALFYL